MSPRPLPLRLLVAVATVALLTAACSPSDGAPPVSAPLSATATPAPATTSASPTGSGPATGDAAPTATSAPVEPAGITIEDFDYDVPASVPPGAQVQLTNQDSEAHTVTLKNGGPSVVVQGGATTTLTAPAEAGTYSIVCDFHGNMSAELVVA